MTDLVQFGHNFVIIVAFGLAGFLSLGLRSFLVVPALVLITLNGVLIGLWLGPTVSRFRDLGPAVASVLQMMAFFTPIFWRLDSVKGRSRGALVNWNPFYYLLETFRAPLIGAPVRHAFIGAGVITVVNLVLAIMVFSRARSRIPYWVA